MPPALDKLALIRQAARHERERILTPEVRETLVELAAFLRGVRVARRERIVADGIAAIEKMLGDG